MECCDSVGKGDITLRADFRLFLKASGIRAKFWKLGKIWNRWLSNRRVWDRRKRLKVQMWERIGNDLGTAINQWNLCNFYVGMCVLRLGEDIVREKSQKESNYVRAWMLGWKIWSLICVQEEQKRFWRRRGNRPLF